MKLTLDTNHINNTIKSYQPGQIDIGNQSYQQSIIIDCDKVICNWPPESYQDLREEHLAILLEQKADIVLLGTGEDHRLIAPSLLQHFLCANIGIEVMSTIAACRTFNALISEGRSVIVALLIK